MTLEGGTVVDKDKIKDIHFKNYQRLLVWQTVGADTINGLWAIYGARLGTVMTNLRRDTWDWKNVRDFEWLNGFWHSDVAPKFAADDINGQQHLATICETTGYQYWEQGLKDEIHSLGQELQDQLDLEIADMDADASRFFKKVYINPSRVAPMALETQVTNEITE